MGEPIFDLFGDVVPEGRRKPGRPQHVPTNENRNRVKMLLAVGWDDGRIAGAVGVTVKTLRKHYSSELVARLVCRDRMEARRLEVLWRQGCDGNVAAMREFGRLVEAQDVATADDGIRASRKAEGKKAAAQREAREALASDEPDSWGSVLPDVAGAPTLQ